VDLVTPADETDCCNRPRCCQAPIEEEPGLEHCGHSRPIGSPRCYSCIQRLETERDILWAALTEIRTTQGRVCANYEFCTHVSCRSSYSSWVIADKALGAPRAEEGYAHH